MCPCIALVPTINCSSIVSLTTPQLGTDNSVTRTSALVHATTVPAPPTSSLVSISTAPHFPEGVSSLDEGLFDRYLYHLEAVMPANQQTSPGSWPAHTGKYNYNIPHDMALLLLLVLCYYTSEPLTRHMRIYVFLYNIYSGQGSS